jgi:hypothetical protein
MLEEGDCCMEHNNVIPANAGIPHTCRTLQHAGDSRFRGNDVYPGFAL